MEELIVWIPVVLTGFASGALLHDGRLIGAAILYICSIGLGVSLA